MGVFPPTPICNGRAHLRIVLAIDPAIWENEINNTDLLEAQTPSNTQ